MQNLIGKQVRAYYFDSIMNAGGYIYGAVSEVIKGDDIIIVTDEGGNDFPILIGDFDVVHNVQFYIYFEDEVLTVGIRSLEPFEGADFDGEFYFTYLEGDHFHRSTFAPFGFESVPESDGVHIFVGGELQDILGYEEDAPSVQFELQLTEQK